MNASFLPSLPLHLSYALLFGVLLVAGMVLSCTSTSRTR